MKTNKMPITFILLAISWFVAALGVIVPVYLFIFKGIGQSFFIIGFLILFVGLILGSLIRMFANIGQIIFESKLELQRIREISNISVQHLLGLSQFLKTAFQSQALELDRIIKGAGQNLKSELQNQNVELERIIKGLNQNLKTELQSQTSELDKIIKGLNQNLRTELQNQNLELDKIVKGLNQSISGGVAGLNRDLISEIKLLTSSLQNLCSSCEQINCDSKDLNQNINQIKSFFEQIERHLDLKQ